MSCGGGSTSTTFTYANELAIDSTNNRLFVSEPDGVLFVMTASTKSHISEDVPYVDDDTRTTIQALLPSTVTHFSAYPTSTTSRLFIYGALPNTSNALVTNRIRVLDFDGTDFTEASFSPIILSDGDATTDDTDNSISDMLIDSSNNRLFVADASAGMIYIIDTTDGTEERAGIAISGTIEKMAFADNRLYVCNSTATAADQVVTVINTTDFSTTTIDLNIPCSEIAVASNGSTVLLLAKHANDQQVLIYSVNTTTYASASAITSADSDFTNGSLTSGSGISSSIEDMIIGIDSDNNYYAYLSETDGNIEFITVDSSLSEYSIETISTAALNITKGDIYTDDLGDAVTGYFVSTSGALLSIDMGTNSVDLDG